MHHIYMPLLFALLFTHALGQGKAKHQPTHADNLKYVQDNAGWLTPAEADSLRSQFARYEKENAVWFSVRTEPTLAGKDVNFSNNQHFYSFKELHSNGTRGVTFSFYGVERKIAIAADITLQDKLTEAQRKYIVDDVMSPLLKAGSNYAVITAGVSEARRILAGIAARESAYSKFIRFLQSDVGGVIIVFLMIISSTVSGTIITKYNIGSNNNHLQNIPLIILVFLPILGAIILSYMGRRLKRNRGSSSGGSKRSSGW